LFLFYKTMESAILQEKQTKSGSRKKKLQLIENMNSEGYDLRIFDLSFFWVAAPQKQRLAMTAEERGIPHCKNKIYEAVGDLY